MSNEPETQELQSPEASVPPEHTAEDSTAEPISPTVPAQSAEPSVEVAEGSETREAILALQNEVQRLNREMASRSRLAEELTEFRILFPDADPAGLPDSVWSSAAEGGPLAAAYALHCRYLERATKLAEEINLRNEREATPPAGRSAESGDFTPAEVRAMSPEEVRLRYDRILSSMKHWS